MHRLLRISVPLTVVALLAVAAGNASAQHYHSQGGYSGYSNGYNQGPVYHAPSVHYDRVFHPEYTHWTPFRGVHTHGHYDAVPHVTPGHFDYQYGNTIVPNRHFHRH